MPALSQFNLIWAEACARYQQVAEVNPSDPSFPRPSSLHDLQTLVEQRNGDFKAFREKRGSLFHALSAIGQPIEVLGKVIADVAADAFPPSAVCYGAISYLIQAAKNVSDSYDAIITLFERLKVSYASERGRPP
jgi:fungal STAND N-terminal Goodbye domain